MKKAIVLLLALSMMFSVFAGGSSDKDVDPNKDQLLWLYETATPEHEQHLKNDLIAVVNENAADYQFSVTFDPNYDQNVRTQLLAGAGPDLVLTAGPSYVEDFAKAGYLASLDEYAEQYGWLDILFPMMVDLGTFNDHLYAVPKTYESMVVFYNKTVFEEYGWSVPETWDEFEALCAEIQSKGIVPLTAGNASWKPTNEHFVTVWLNHIAGPDMVKKALDNEISWSDPVFVESMADLQHFFVDKYVNPDYFSYSEDDALSALADGTCAMYVSGTWNFQKIDDFFVEMGTEWDWAPIPSAEGVDYPLYTVGVGATLSINAKSKRPDAVAELLNTLFTDKDVIVNLNVDWPGEWNLPIVTIDKNDFGDRIDSRYARCLDEIGNAINDGNYGYVTWTFWPEKTNLYIWEEAEKLFMNTITPEAYLAGMDAVFQTEL